MRETASDLGAEVMTTAAADLPGAAGVPHRTLPRIAFVTSVYEQMHVGGGAFVQYLREAVEDGTLDLTIFSDDMEENANMPPYARRVRIPSLIAKLPGGWLIRSFYYRRAVRREHRLAPFDLVWHNNAIIPLAQVLRRRDIPVVGMINDYNLVESKSPFATRLKFGWKRSFIRFLWRQAERFVARRLDIVVVNSSFMARTVREAYGLSDDRIEVLYKGVSLDQFVPQSRTATGLLRLLFVKSDFIRGGLEELLEALKDFPRDFTLSIIGPPASGVEKVRLLVSAAGIQDRVTVESHVERARMPEVFASHDILCVPSRSEALGVAFLEALACGVPVLTCNVGGIPEVLDHGRAGWLVPPSDPETLRATLLHMVDNLSEVRTKSQTGLEHVKAFSVPRMIRSFLAVAETLSAAHVRRSP